MSLTHRRALLLAAALVLAVAGPVPAAGGIQGLGGKTLLEQIREHRSETWRWQRLMDRPLARGPRRDAVTTPAARLLALRDLWRERAARARAHAQRPPHLGAWLCIHRYEGAWSDPGAPYYGGLQMDLGFQRTYGSGLLARKGTADRWTPLEQMWVAERALRAGREFHPWPAAARRCGLL